MKTIQKQNLSELKSKAKKTVFNNVITSFKIEGINFSSQQIKSVKSQLKLKK